MEVAYDGVAYYATDRLSRDQIQGMERQQQGEAARAVFLAMWDFLNFGQNRSGGV
jgi:hypothetical protein